MGAVLALPSGGIHPRRRIREAAVVAVLILISSLDDLFVDFWYWTRRVWWRITEPYIRPLTANALAEKDEQPIAIIIRPGHEADVIAAMIENAVSVLDYRRYIRFVGTYPNDPETIAEVERMRRSASSWCAWRRAIPAPPTRRTA